MCYQLFIVSKCYLFTCLLFSIILHLDNSEAMKAVIQRVLSASVTVDGEVISSVGKGLCVLVGIHRNDTEKELEFLVRKILNLKIFANNDGKDWMASVVEKDFEVLCISQFTLDFNMKGNRLDFHRAMVAEKSEPLFNHLLSSLRSQYKEEKIKAGKFGAKMLVQLVNDGPVTLQLESPSPKE